MAWGCSRTRWVHMEVEKKYGECVSALSAGAYTTTLLVMVVRVKRVGHAPPPHTFTRLGWFYHHDEMHIRKRPLPLCMYSVAIPGGEEVEPALLSWDVPQLCTPRTPWPRQLDHGRVNTALQDGGHNFDFEFEQSCRWTPSFSSLHTLVGSALAQRRTQPEKKIRTIKNRLFNH